MSNRVCNKCRWQKPRTEFTNDRHAPDGISRWCKECQSKARAKQPSRLARLNPRPPIPTAQPGDKHCARCKTIKPIADFGNNKRCKDGRQDWCKACIRAYNVERLSDPVFAAKEKQRLHDRYHKHPRGNAAHLKRMFGITAEQYNAMREAQGHRCAICKRHQSSLKRRLAVDHDHATNTIRGLLCTHCNVAIGHFLEDPDLFYAAVDYLRQHQRLVQGELQFT